MHRSRYTHSKGFTLIEMAFIIMIVGIMAATILPRLVSGIKVDRAREAKAWLIEARDEIIGETYADALEHKLPLASGVELVPATLKHVNDPWNSPIRYFIANNQDGDPLTDAYAICKATNTDLEVVINGVTYNDIAFIVVSTGKDMTAEYTDVAGPPRVITGFAPGHTDAGAGIDEYDDLIEFVTLDYLKEKISPCETANPTASDPDVTFEDELASFDDPGFQGGTSVLGNDFIVSDPVENTLTLGSSNLDLGAACAWYAGSSGTCSNGVCTFGEGVRVFYRYKNANSGTAPPFGGFTFAIINSDNNVATACGDTAGGFGATIAGISGRLGYAGGGLTNPKLGVEFDTTAGSNLNIFGGGPAVNENGPTIGHMGLDYWGTTGSTPDDVSHGAGADNPAEPTNPDPYPAGVCIPPVAGAGMYCDSVAGNQAWLDSDHASNTDGYHTVRIDIYRGGGTHEPPQVGAALATGIYRAVVTYDGAGAEVGNVSVDYDPIAEGDTRFFTYSNPTALNAALESDFDDIRFGFTMSAVTGLGSDGFIIKDFSLKFID